ncbi:MAG: hypothetical protein AB1815_02540 [Bacillota bacterium]
MRFAIVNVGDGTIWQINDAIGAFDTLEDINAKLPKEFRAIECGSEVTTQHIYSMETGEWAIIPTPEVAPKSPDQFTELRENQLIIMDALVTIFEEILILRGEKL